MLPLSPNLGASPEKPIYFSPVWSAVSVAAAGASAYHGYKRTGSVGWAFGWFLFGGALPIFAVPVALAQGYGKKKASR